MSPKGVGHSWHFYYLARGHEMSVLKRILKSCPSRVCGFLYCWMQTQLARFAGRT